MFGAALYAAGDTAGLPDQAVASLGCGSPTAVTDLRPGERVLDLGSGGGIVAATLVPAGHPTSWARPRRRQGG